MGGGDRPERLTHTGTRARLADLEGRGRALVLRPGRLIQGAANRLPPLPAPAYGGLVWDVRPVERAELELYRSRISRGFGHDAEPGDDAADRFSRLFEVDRMLAAFDGPEMIGTAGAFSFTLSVPGGEVAMGGTTVVTVQPTHRRKGVLTELMSHHLAEMRDRGEPLAGLWASESGIYGRFGYGPAAYGHRLEIAAGGLDMRGDAPPGDVSLVEAEEAEPLMRDIYERVRPRTPGMLSRSDTWWSHRRMWDGESARRGKSARRYAVYGKGNEISGYATYRQKAEWDELPSGLVDIIEVQWATPEAHHGLWRFLCSIDLFPNVKWWNAPLDDPLQFRVSDPRRLTRRLTDTLWLRLLDVPAALAGRTYAEDTDGLVLKVSDRSISQNSGTYQLRVGEGRATCEPVDAAPDITLDVEVLGQLYLGGADAVSLARAGRIEASPDTALALHRLFRHDRAPWCPEVF